MERWMYVAVAFPFLIGFFLAFGAGLWCRRGGNRTLGTIFFVVSAPLAIIVGVLLLFSVS